MANKLYPNISDDSSSPEREPPTDFELAIREAREYGTIPSSENATQAALAHHLPYSNPVVPRGPVMLKRKKKLKATKIKDNNTVTSTVCIIL